MIKIMNNRFKRITAVIIMTFVFFSQLYQVMAINDNEVNYYVEIEKTAEENMIVDDNIIDDIPVNDGEEENDINNEEDIPNEDDIDIISDGENEENDKDNENILGLLTPFSLPINPLGNFTQFVANLEIRTADGLAEIPRPYFINSGTGIMLAFDLKDLNRIDMDDLINLAATLGHDPVFEVLIPDGINLPTMVTNLNVSDIDGEHKIGYLTTVAPNTATFTFIASEIDKLYHEMYMAFYYMHINIACEIDEDGKFDNARSGIINLAPYDAGKNYEIVFADRAPAKPEMFKTGVIQPDGTYLWTVSVQAPNATQIPDDYLKNIKITDTTGLNHALIGDIKILGTKAGEDTESEVIVDSINKTTTGFNFNMPHDYNGNISITYRTVLTEDGMLINEAITLPNNIVMDFNGTDQLIANTSIHISKDNFQLLGKDGVFLPDEKAIEWKVIVNTRGQHYQTLNLIDTMSAPYQRYNVKINGQDPVVAPAYLDTVGAGTGGVMTLPLFQNGNALYSGSRLEITYRTPIYNLDYSNPEVGDSVNNTATLFYEWIFGGGYGPGTWQPMPVPPTVEKESNVSPMPVKKEALFYNPGTRKITWLITVNENKMNLTDIILTDTPRTNANSGVGIGGIHSTAKYVVSSWVGPDGPDAVTDNGDGTFILPNLNGVAATFRITTEVTDAAFLKGNNKETFHNQIDISANIGGIPRTGTDRASIEADNDVLKKTAGNYDYSNHTQEWTIVANSDHISDVTNAIMTDMIPIGQQLIDKSSIPVDDGTIADPTSIFDGLPPETSVSVSGNADNTVTTVIFTFKDSLNNDLLDGKTAVIRYRTLAPISNDNTGISFTNSVQLTSSLGSTPIIAATAPVAIRLLQKSTVSVERPNSTTAGITYRVLINQSAVPFSNAVTVSDTITPPGSNISVDFDLGSFKLYPATINANGAFNFTPSNDPIDYKDYIALGVNVNPLTNNFTATIPAGTGAAVLEYSVVARATTGTVAGGLSNTIRYTNLNIDGGTSYNANNIASLSNSSGAGGMMGRMAFVEITKKEDLGKPDFPTQNLAGVTFGLYLKKGGGFPALDDEPIARAVSGSDGKIRFEMLMPIDVTDAHYFIREISAPTGYMVPTSPNDGFIQLNDPKFTSIGANGYGITINNTRTAYNVSFTKVNLADMVSNIPQPLLGATFTITDDHNNGAGIIATEISDADGKVTFASLKWGVYTIKETGVPTGGFVPYSGEYKLTITPLATAPYHTISLARASTGVANDKYYPTTLRLAQNEITNEKPSITITLKDAQSGNTIIGNPDAGLNEGKFKLQIRNAADNGWEDVGAAVDSVSGVLRFANDDLEYGKKYQVIQVQSPESPPTGYVSDPIPKEFIFDDPTREGAHQTYNWEYTRKGMYDFYFMKSIQNYANGMKTNTSPSTTEVATFVLRKKSDGAGGAIIETITSDATGKVHFGAGLNKLSFDDYYIYEITAPTGYALPLAVNEPILEVNLIRETYDSSRYIIKDLRTTPATTIVDRKVDEYGAPIAETTNTPLVNEKGSFIIAKKDGLYPAAATGFANFAVIVSSSEGTYDINTTNTNGIIIIEGLTLGITYTFTEKIAPTGYAVNVVPLSFTPTPGAHKATASATGTVDRTADLINDRSTLNNFSFRKIGPSADADGLDTGLGEAIFSLTFTGAAPAGSQVLPSPWVSRTQTQTSTLDGTVAFTNLPFGNYTITETTAPAGYIRNTTPITFTIAPDGTISSVTGLQGTAGNYTFSNTLGSYTLTKRDAVSNVTMDGIEFILQYSFDNITWQDNYRIGLFTNSSGVLSLTNLPMGSYKLVEKNVPEGYVGHGGTPEIAHEFTLADAAGQRDVFGTMNNARSPEYSIGFIKQDDRNINRAGAVFGLFTNAAATTAIHSFNANGAPVTSGGTPITATSAAVTGIVSFTNLPFGTYYIKEISPPNAVGLNSFKMSEVVLKAEITADGKYTLTRESGNAADISGTATDVTAGTISSLIVKNELLGSMTITIVDDEDPANIVTITNNNYSATFRVYKPANIDGDGKPINPNDYVATGTTEGGVVTFTGLTIGELYVIVNTAVNPLSIYSTSKDNFIFTLIYDISDDSNYHQEADVPLGGNKYFDFMKVDIYDDPIYGAVFGLYYDADGNNPVGAYPLKAVSDVVGKVEFIDLKAGTYYVREENASIGYLGSNVILKVEIDVNNISMITDNDTGTSIDRLVNFVRKDYSFGFIKKDSQNNNLAGAEFGLYADSACTEEIYGFSDGGTPLLTGVTPRKAVSAALTGRVIFDELPFGTYYVKELTVPKAIPDVYVKSDAILKIVVEKNGTFTITEVTSSGEVFGTANNIAKNTVSNLYMINELLGSITVRIVNDEELGKPLITNNNYSATFRIYEAAKLDGDGHPLDPADFVAEGTTVDGIASFPELPLDVDYVAIFWDKPMSSVFDWPNEDIAVKLIFDISDPAKRHRILTVPLEYKNDKTFAFEKVSYLGPLGGADFGLYYDVACTMPVGGHNHNDAWSDPITGEVRFTDLKPGTYYVREYTPPVGYVLDSLVLEVEIDTYGNVTIVDNATKNPVTAVFNNRRIDYSFGFIKEDDYGNKLPGAVFGLYGDTECITEIHGVNTDGSLITGGGSPITATSAAVTGIVSFNNLPYGTYYVKELSEPVPTPPNKNRYIKSEAVLKVVIAPDGKYTITRESGPATDISGNATNVTAKTVSSLMVKNELLGSMAITIVDKENLNTIINNNYSATFRIYEPANIDGDGKPIDPNNYIATGTTVDGIITFTGLKIGEEYVIVNTALNPLSIYSLSKDNIVFTLIYDLSDETKYHMEAEVPLGGDKYFDFIKVDSYDAPLSTAVFGIYHDAAGNNPVGPIPLKATSNDAGKVEFVDLKAGTYYVREESAPMGYTESNIILKVTIDLSDNVVITDNATGIALNRLVNYVRKDYSFGFIKKDSQNNNLAGAEFGLYADSACTDEIYGFSNGGTPLLTGVTPIKEISAALTGRVIFDELPFGTYYVKELTAPIALPDTYVKSDAVLKVVVEKDGTYTITEISSSGEVFGTADNIMKNTVSNLYVINELLGSITVRIINDEELGKPLITNNNYSATFRIYEASKLDGDGHPLDPADFVAEGTTVDGIAAFPGLPLDVDYVVILWQKNLLSVFAYPNEDFPVNLVYSAGDQAEYHRTLDIPLFYKGDKSFSFTKESYEGPLAGAMFGLYYDAACTSPVGGHSHNDAFSAPLTGEVKYNELKPGIYYVREYAPPTGYLLDSVVLKIAIDTYGNYTIVNNVNNDPVTTIFNNRRLDYSFGFIKEDDYGNKLPGAAFGLYSDASCSTEIHGFNTDGSHIISGGTPITVTSATVSGEVEFTNLPYGIYYVKELSVPTPAAPSKDRYNKSEVILKVVVTPNGDYTITRESGPEDDIDGIAINVPMGTISNLIVKNELLGSLRVEVKDIFGPLSGVSLSLYREGSLIATGISDAFGFFTFYGLTLNQTYMLVQGDLTSKGYAAMSGIMIKLTYDLIYGDEEHHHDFAKFENEGATDLEIVGINLLKQDAGGNPLDLAEFGIIRSDDPPAPDFTPNIDNIISDVDGNVVLPNLSHGIYYLREIDPPDGFLLSNTILKIEISDLEKSLEWHSGEMIKTLPDGSKVVVNHRIPGPKVGGNNNSGNINENKKGEWAYNHETGEWEFVLRDALPQTGVRDFTTLIYLLSISGLVILFSAIIIRKRGLTKK